MTLQLPTDLGTRLGPAVVWEVLRHLAVRAHASTQFRVRSLSESDHVTLHLPDASAPGGLRRIGFFHVRGRFTAEAELRPVREGHLTEKEVAETVLLSVSTKDYVEALANRLGISLSSQLQMTKPVLAIGLLADVTALAAIRWPGFFPRCGWRDAAPVTFDVDQPAPWLKNWVKTAKRYETNEPRRVDRFWLLETPRPCLLDVARARVWLSPTSKDAEDLWALSHEGRDPAAASAWLLRKTGLLEMTLPLRGVQMSIDLA